jgi:uroporphyrinogen-III synthase
LKTLLSTKIIDTSLYNLLLLNNFKVIAHDFISIEPIIKPKQSIENHIIITSKNAIQAIENYSIETLKIFCVGNETQKILLEKGFNVIETAKNAETLAKIIVEKHSNYKFTYFCSEIRRTILPNIFKENNIDCQEINAYKTILQPKVITENIDFILFFSPSGVKSYLVYNLINNELCICIGKTTAQELESITNNLFISSSSTIKEMVLEIVEKF